LFSTLIFRKEHFFHDLFPMVVAVVPGSFGAAFNCECTTAKMPRGSRKPGFEESRREKYIL